MSETKQNTEETEPKTVEPEEAPQAAETAPQEERDERSELIQKLDEATAEARTNHERYLREVAEMQNYRKRVQREKDELRRYAVSSLAEDILPALDNLALGIASARQHHPEAKGVIDGVAMVQTQLSKVLSEHGIEPVNPQPGDTFDPNFHDAVSQSPSDEIEEGKVLSVSRVGYRLHERLLRPAAVVVSSGNSEEQA